MKNTEFITEKLLREALDYSQYRTLIKELLKENKVTGDFMKNNEWILKYTKMNNVRMDNAETNFTENNELKKLISSITESWTWLVITEGWCGDAAQIIPALVKIAKLNPKFSIKFILRDEHPQVMDAYLSNGSRSIPKLIVVNSDTLEEIGTWGPRPEVPQKMTMDFKKDKEKSFDEYVEELHAWYEEDNFQAIQKELMESLRTWMA